MMVNLVAFADKLRLTWHRITVFITSCLDARLICAPKSKA